MIPIQHGQFSSFSLFNLIIDTEAFLMTIGMTIFFILLILELIDKKYISSFKDALLLIAYVVPLLILGSRLWTYLIPWRGIAYFLKFFYELDITIVSFGMIIGGFIGLELFFKKKGLRRTEMLELFNPIALFFSISILFLRMGCFLNGHLIGNPSDLPWCIIKYDFCRHPVGLYFAIVPLMIILIVNLLFYRDKIFKQIFPGEKAFWFMISYIGWRIFADIFLIESYCSSMCLQKLTGYLFIPTIAIIYILHEIIMNYYLKYRLRLSKKEFYNLLNSHSFLSIHKSFYMLVYKDIINIIKKSFK
jgi:prolipoprotein diacylglyceryltransferase